jgi:hypothetical protein
VEALNNQVEGALFIMFVCTNHVKDALELMYVPHIKLISEEESFRCHLCKNKAKYKLFQYCYQRNQTKKAI